MEDTLTEIDRKVFVLIVSTMIENIDLMHRDLIAFIRARSNDQIADLAEVIIYEGEGEGSLYDLIDAYVDVYRNDLEY